VRTPATGGRAADPLPQGVDKARHVRELFESIAGRYDLVNRVMTVGMDAGWRRRAVRELRLPGGTIVLDLACGTGDLGAVLESSGYRTVGIDFAAAMLRRARTRVGASLVQADILRLPLRDATADGAVSGFALRNVVSLEVLFAEVARVVRSGGRVSLLDASRPNARVLRAGHGLYIERVVPLIGGLLASRSAYAYLPRSMAYLPEPQAMLEMLQAAGFHEVRRLQLSGGIVQVLTGTRS
jgi:demethylmenaquinone methyltransferase / 2-methoxy-6-polyprenyl-1,4-benzoquinol methylase